MTKRASIFTNNFSQEEKSQPQVIDCERNDTLEKALEMVQKDLETSNKHLCEALNEIEDLKAQVAVYESEDEETKEEVKDSLFGHPSEKEERRSKLFRVENITPHDDASARILKEFEQLATN